MSASAHLHREERVVRKDEQCLPIGAAENDLERTLRHVDPPDLLAGWP